MFVALPRILSSLPRGGYFLPAYKIDDVGLRNFHEMSTVEKLDLMKFQYLKIPAWQRGKTSLIHENS